VSAPSRVPRRRRVESALDHDLEDHSEIGPAERAALRAQARALDLAEALADPAAVSTANKVYLELREAAGLTLAGARPAETPFDELLRELTRPGAGAGDPERLG
jgi:hypothetical protein